MTISFNVRLRGELAMPHEKERKKERGMQFRVALRMLIPPGSINPYEFPETRCQIFSGNINGIS